LIHPPLIIPTIGIKARLFKKKSNHWKEIMEYAKIGAPMFEGHNYGFQSIRMKTFLQEHGFDVWRAIVDGYKAPTTPPIEKDGKKLKEKKSKAKCTILNSLSNSVFFKVMHCDFSKYL
jgi:hypothetical protein